MTKAIDRDGEPVLRVAIPSPLRSTFDYLPPPTSEAAQWQPGMRLLVPFGRRKLVGVLLETSQTANVAVGRLRRAYNLLDESPAFSPALMRLLQWAAAYYQHPVGEVFSTALPSVLRTTRCMKTPAPIAWRATSQANTDAEELQRAPRQQALLRTLISSGPLTLTDCRKRGFESRVLRQLQQRGFIESVDAIPEKTPVFPADGAQIDALQVNPDQRNAIDRIERAEGFSCFLLEGVTGSGKTEVYLHAIAGCLRRDRQAMILVPEISLTPQTIHHFRQRFACPVAVMHSGLTAIERLRAWQQMQSGSAGIIIGTRSAVFAPMAKPGIIVVDEEHDGSFKQQDGFRYSARDLAVMRAREENITVVLGSATPSLESLHNARSGKFHHLRLHQRAGGATNPKVILHDAYGEDFQAGIAAPVLQKMKRHLERNYQVLVFLNRRGFAPVLQCSDCGWIYECRGCDTQLTVHKTPPSLHCHHCDTASALPAHCSDCQSRQLQALGMGTERSEASLQDLFPEYPVVRVDRDSTRRKLALQKLLDQVHEGKPCILLGTQMLAKGHHFPKVTLVLILDADRGLFSADFRGQEHMAQLLIQVAGRSGRAAQTGEVVIQTRHGTHATLQALAAFDYPQIADQILAERKAARMPPYSYLALLRAESHEPGPAIDFLNSVNQMCRDSLHTGDFPGTEIQGPLPSPMERRAGRYRMQLLVKNSSRGHLQKLLAAVCPKIDQLKGARMVRWCVDVDPQDLI
ncbi:MAG: primosomal protein N' [Pseudohongiellaceae bacterium]